MSNTTYKRRAGTPIRVKKEVAHVDVDEYLDEEELEYEEEEQPTGLFSTPARKVTLIASIGLVLVLFSSVIWLITSRTTQEGVVLGVPTNTSKNNLAIKVSVITKANLGGANEAPRKGAKAPDFEWNDATNGNPLRLTTLGKPLLVNFWGTWCPPCRAEMPEMQKMYDKYRGQIEFVGVSMGPRDDPMGVMNFINQPPNGTPPIPYTWRFVHDSNYDVATRYEVQAVPSSYFVGSDGVIKAVQVGGMNAAQLEAYLQQVK